MLHYWQFKVEFMNSRPLICKCHLDLQTVIMTFEVSQIHILSKKVIIFDHCVKHHKQKLYIFICFWECRAKPDNYICTSYHLHIGNIIQHIEASRGYER